MKHTFDVILVREANLKRWCLRLMTDGVEIGGGEFAPPLGREDAAKLWWDGLKADDRDALFAEISRFSIDVTSSYYALAFAYNEALTMGRAWLMTRS